MSAAPEIGVLIDATDVEEIERDLRRSASLASTVAVNPPLEKAEKRSRKKRRIAIPVDDVRPSTPTALGQSWLSLLYPVDLDSLVEEAFSSERLAQVPEPLPAEEDDDIEVDIELEEVESVERQEPQSGVIAVPSPPAGPPPSPTPAPEPEAAAPTVEAEADAAGTPPPLPRADSAPPPPPADAGGPPPVPLSAFTGESDRVERIPEAEAAQEPEAEASEESAAEPAAGGPPPVPTDVVEPADGADEAVFESEDTTVVDEDMPPLTADTGAPPPIPEGATPAAATESEPTEAATPSEAGAAPPPPPAAAPEAPEDARPSPPPPPSGTPPPTLAATSDVPEEARAGPPPPPAAAPPAVPEAAPAQRKAKRPRKFKKPWFEEFFDDDYLRTIPFMTPTYTRKEMEYIRSHLKVPDGSKLLDVGCGYGRLAIEFAREGYDVTGLDTSLPLMFKAAEASTEMGVEVNFMHQDMREMSFDGEFDGVYCVMTSFGYFDDETNQDVVRRMFRALKPGGRLFVEVINRDFILNDLPSRVWWEGDDCVVMDEVEFNFLTSRVVSKRSVVFSDGRSVNHDLSIRAYCLHELGRMLHNNGFRVESVTGNINTDNRFFGQHSPYLIVLSEKPKK